MIGHEFPDDAQEALKPVISALVDKVAMVAASSVPDISEATNLSPDNDMRTINGVAAQILAASAGVIVGRMIAIMGGICECQKCEARRMTMLGHVARVFTQMSANEIPGVSMNVETTIEPIEDGPTLN